MELALPVFDEAIETIAKIIVRVEEYLFTMLWDAPSAALGTTPRKAFEQDMKRSPDPETEHFVLPPDQAEVAFFPEVDGGVRLVQPGRGVYVEGYYYWSKRMRN